MLLGGIMMLRNFCVNCSEESIDTLCDIKSHEFYNMQNTSSKLQINNIIASFYSSGYCFKNIFSPRAERRGSDKVWRSSILAMSCTFITNDRIIHCFERKESLLTGEVSETHKLFRYETVQAISCHESERTASVVISLSNDDYVEIYCKSKEEAMQICDSMRNIAWGYQQKVLPRASSNLECHGFD